MFLDYRIRHICNVKTKQFDAKKMTGFFDIKSPNWLGGTNVRNTLALIGIAYLVYKTAK
jgi:hypothetical protein